MTNQFDIGGLKIEKEIARGYNAVVYSATDLFDRKVAIKIWNRQCYSEQWYEETKKLIQAYDVLNNYHEEETGYFVKDASDKFINSHKYIGNIYFGGVIHNHPYVVMEYINGPTLYEFITSSKVPFGLKYNIAHKLCEVNNILINNNIVHDDLHSHNIILSNYSDNINTILFQNKDIGFQIKLLDFGNVNANEKNRINLNYRKLIDTINFCIKPFNLYEIHAAPPPSNMNSNIDMNHWIHKQLHAIRAAFFEMGHEYVGWPLYRQFGTYALTTNGFGIDLLKVKMIIEHLVNKGELVLSREFLGQSEYWDTFDGRYARRGD